MDAYYIKHRFLSVYRSRNSGNNWFAGVILFLVGFQIISMLYVGFPELVIQVQTVRPDFSVHQATTLVFIFCLLLGGVLLFSFSPAKLHYQHYAIWKTDRKDITIGYLLLVPLSPVPLAWILVTLPIVVRSAAEVDHAFLHYFILFYAIVYFSIVVHFTRSKLPLRMIGIGLFLGASVFLLQLSTTVLLPPVWISVLLLVVCIAWAVLQINRYQLHVGEDTETKHSGTIWDLFSFKEGWMQLEWALMTRNKRTRGNLIAGFVSIPIIYMMIANTSEDISFTPVILIGTVMTAFVMLQHGLYTVGWEGSYFDLILSRTSLSSFFHFKFRFFLLSSLVMFLVTCFSVYWKPMLFLPLTATFLYNIGINSFIILQGSLRNTTKLSLDQGTVFNTQAINGTVLANSFIIVLVPLMLFGIANAFIGEVWASVILGAIGGVGLMLRKAILTHIISEAQKRKYKLANGFRS